MSSKKPNKVFKVFTADEQEIYVIARHPKGARSVAEYHGYKIASGKMTFVEVSRIFADQAINKDEK